jgi:hypothetical protein
MKLRVNSPIWFNEDHPEKQAKCVLFPADRDHDPWYVDTEEESADAKSICLGIDDGRECPLLSECLEFAMINNERFGIWGGKTPEERAALRKERRACQKRDSNQAGESLPDA